MEGPRLAPADDFARMFGDPKDDWRKKSVLDVVYDDARQIRSELTRGDQRRLDESLESERSLESLIEARRGAFGND